MGRFEGPTRTKLLWRYEGYIGIEGDKFEK